MPRASPCGDLKCSRNCSIKSKTSPRSSTGLAQSLVRFLVSLDRNALVQFLQALKEGKNESKALMESYHGSRQDLVREWTLFWQRGPGKPIAKHRGP